MLTLWRVGRHMEAPDRFRAIQTYRAAMAIIAQQKQLIVRMYNTAVLTENEQEIMQEVCSPEMLSS